MFNTPICRTAGLATRRCCAAVVALLVGGSCALATAQTTAGAASATASDSRNVYLAGGTVRPAGPVDGDFVAIGGRVIADQPVGGDALLAGGSVDVRAPVGDDLRAAGGDVNVESTVGGELYAAGGNVTLTRAAQVGQGAALAAGLLTIDGKVSGNLKASAQHIVLNGEVTGDARLVAEQIELGPTARIGGALHHASREFKKADGAVVAGALTQDEPAQHKGTGNRQWERAWHYSGPSWVGLALGYLGLLAASAVFVLLFPRFSAQAPQRIGGAPWLSLAVGFGVLVGVPVLALLLFITLLGIPLGLAALSLYPLLLLTGYLSGVAFVAQKAGVVLRTAESRSFAGLMGLMAIALLVLMLVGQLPMVGALTVFLTTIAGLGACVLEWQHHRRPTPAPPG